MSKHRADVRPRWGRIAASAIAATVVAIALLATVGLWHRAGDATALDPAAGDVATQSGSASATPGEEATTPDDPAGTASRDLSAAASETGTDTSTDTSTSTGTSEADDVAVPADSGSGRRAVFSESQQRVWIVDADGTVERTYPVSGSVEDNLPTGTYSVYSRSQSAYGVDDSGTMKWFVRFTHGTDSGAAIGFHDIPVKDGKPLQTVAQLGTPQSHGCIRQKESDALAMWDFAQVGTKVVVTA
ncbi:MAG: L,D-transpeptidase [Nocardioides sp.]|uniref:L,D-transpeptidase n=1 Tax=Nocardioides sp. TaxID=35761 RepID=UPI0039E3D289